MQVIINPYNLEKSSNNREHRDRILYRLDAAVTTFHKAPSTQVELDRIIREYGFAIEAIDWLIRNPSNTIVVSMLMEKKQYVIVNFDAIIKKIQSDLAPSLLIAKKTKEEEEALKKQKLELESKQKEEAIVFDRDVRTLVSHLRSILDNPSILTFDVLLFEKIKSEFLSKCQEIPNYPFTSLNKIGVKHLIGELETFDHPVLRQHKANFEKIMSQKKEKEDEITNLKTISSEQGKLELQHKELRSQYDDLKFLYVTTKKELTDCLKHKEDCMNKINSLTTELTGLGTIRQELFDLKNQVIIKNKKEEAFTAEITQLRYTLNSCITDGQTVALRHSEVVSVNNVLKKEITTLKKMTEDAKKVLDKKQSFNDELSRLKNEINNLNITIKRRDDQITEYLKQIAILADSKKAAAGELFCDYQNFMSVIKIGGTLSETSFFSNLHSEFLKIKQDFSTKENNYIDQIKKMSQQIHEMQSEETKLRLNLQNLDKDYIIKSQHIREIEHSIDYKSKYFFSMATKAFSKLKPRLEEILTRQKINKSEVFMVKEWSQVFIDTFGKGAEFLIGLNINLLTREESKWYFQIFVFIGNQINSKIPLWLGNELNRKWNHIDMKSSRTIKEHIERAQVVYFDWVDGNASEGFRNLNKLVPDAFHYSYLLNMIRATSVPRPLLTFSTHV
jgi:hypothetical protein